MLPSEILKTIGVALLAMWAVGVALILIGGAGWYSLQLVFG